MYAAMPLASKYIFKKLFDKCDKYHYKFDLFINYLGRQEWEDSYSLHCGNQGLPIHQKHI